jgi:tetratricopeptide (TPR) repeat protein
LTLASAFAVIGALLIGGLWFGNRRAEPSDAVAHYNRGVELQVPGKSEDAIDEFRTAIRRKPDDVVAPSKLGHALREQGKLEEPVAAYRETVRIKPDAANRIHVGEALADWGKLDEAIAEFRKARDNAQARSELAQEIEKVLNALDHHAD